MNTTPPLPGEDHGPDRHTMRRAVAAAMIGNATEWYDYAAYGYLSVVLGDVFFPSSNPILSRLASFATFAVAFAIRPLGALVLGPLSDSIGRKRALEFTILAMATATAVIGVLPGYSAVGVAAPVMLLLARLIQGFAVGGEYGGASTFVVEYAPTPHRGFWASWLEGGAIGGFLLASGLTTLLTFGLSDPAMHAWGWRIPFLVALPLGSIGLYLRLRLTDTPNFTTLTAQKSTAEAPVRDTFAGQRKRVLICAGIMIYSFTGTYVLLTYMPSFLSEDIALGSGTAQLMVFIAGAFLTCSIPFAGIVSDRVGRKTMLLTAACGYIVLAWPAIWLITRADWPWTLLGLLLLTLCHIPVLGTTTATLPALFPARVRGTGVAIGYNFSSALFGGTAPLVLTFLVDRIDSLYVPAGYLAVLAAVSLVAIAFSFETARQPLESRFVAEGEPLP